MLDAIQALLNWEFLPWSVLGILATGWGIGQAGNRVANDPIQKFKENFAMIDWPHSVALLIILIWGVLFVVLFFGLCSFILQIIALTFADTQSEQAHNNFLIVKTGALTAVLGAVVALPFTALRLKEMRKSNEELRNQTQHNADVLFNDKLHEANNDLHARYQVTEHSNDGPPKDIWRDDIIKRNGAIDRLEALANERPETAPRIARMLSVYLKEMSKEHPPELYDASWDKDETDTWRRKINRRKRSDMENAAQVLGRLREIEDVNLEKLHIDLAEVNLQAMRLSELDFDTADFDDASLDGAELHWAKLNRAKLNGAKLNRAKLHWAWLNRAELKGAKLNGAELNGAWLNKAELIRAELNGAELNKAEMNEAELKGARLHWTELKEADLYGAKLYGAELYGAVLNENTDLRDVRAAGTALRAIDIKKVKNLQKLLEWSFGDGTVELPTNTPWPAKWPKHKLDDDDFFDEWEKFIDDPEGYVPPKAKPGFCDLRS